MCRLAGKSRERCLARLETGTRDPEDTIEGCWKPLKAARLTTSLEESMKPPGQWAGRGVFTISFIFILTPVKQKSHHFL